nr:zinc finger, CCHC-type [Tanacetum cinerariifolium]
MKQALPAPPPTIAIAEVRVAYENSFEGPFDTKENMIIDLKLEYQTFRAKQSESLSQTYTCYKTLLNELTNDGVTLSKHEINDEEEVSDDMEMTQVKVVMALADDELPVGKNHALNGEWIDITMRKALCGKKFLDWYRNLRIFLKSKQRLVHMEQALPVPPPTIAIAEVHVAYANRCNEQ